jgi:DNA-directed RNA polymerase specialized sigma24 family protein
MRATAIACGAPEDEVDDLVATIVRAAWEGIQRGDFQLHPWADPDEALRHWLHGIVWRLSSHERERARHHREVLTPAPWALVARLSPEEEVLNPEPQLEARSDLRLIAELPVAQQDLLVAVGEGMTTAEIAQSKGLSVRAVQIQLARARSDLNETARKIV